MSALMRNLGRGEGNLEPIKPSLVTASLTDFSSATEALNRARPLSEGSVTLLQKAITVLLGQEE